MDFFTWNYMNIFANVLYMLLMLSPSMSISLLDFRQTLHMNLAVTTVALIRTYPWVLYVLYHVVTTASEWTTPLKYVYVVLCCVFLVELGLIPFNLELTFTVFSPLCIIGIQRILSQPTTSREPKSLQGSIDSYLTHILEGTWEPIPFTSLLLSLKFLALPTYPNTLYKTYTCTQSTRQWTCLHMIQHNEYIGQRTMATHVTTHMYTINMAQ